MRSWWPFGAFVLLASLLGCSCDPDEGVGDGGTAKDGGIGTDGGPGLDGGPRPDVDIEGTLVVDETFGDDGLLRVQSTGSTDWIWAATRTPEGDILAAGSTTNGLGHRFEALVTRFDVDGALDPGWGEGGVALISRFDSAVVTGIVALDDGGALISGYADYGRQRLTFVGRLDPTGAFDPSFGTAGTTTWDGGFNGVYMIARADDGSIYAFTESDSSSRPELRRLDSDGTIDTTFGDGGTQTVLGQQPRELLILSDGSLLALAGVDSGDSFVTRLSPTGAVDTDYGESGAARIQFEAFAMAVSPNEDELLVAGDSPGALLKLDATGERVFSFGTNGMLGVGSTDELIDVKWLPSGDIFALEAEEQNFPAGAPVAVHHLRTDGSTLAFDSSALGNRGSWLSFLFATDTAVYLVGSEQDQTIAQVEARVLALDWTGARVGAFAQNGLARAASTATPELLWDLWRQDDGSIISVGQSFVAGLLVRFVGGAQDTSFGDGGFINTNPIAGPLLRVTGDDQGRIIGPSGPHLVRILPDGTADPSFGVRGQVDVVPANASLHAVAVDADQRIITAGEVIGREALVARVLSDGTPDPGFGQDGVVMSPGDLVGSFFAIIAEDDGIVLAGVDNRSMLVVRLALDGTLDEDFGEGGSTAIEGGPFGYRLLPRAGGGYLVGGYAVDCRENCLLSVVALRPSGDVDTSFGEDGTASVMARYYAPWMGMAQLGDRSIVLAGAIEGDQIERFAVWRLSEDGQLDPGFGDEGVLLLPGRGRATAVLAIGDGAWVAGTQSHPTTGTDGVVLQLKSQP